MQVPRTSCAPRMVVCLALLGAVSCKVRLISPYDETTDKAVTALQRKTSDLLTSLEGSDPSPPYEEFRAVYGEVRNDLRAIRVRNEVRPDNRLTVEQLELLRNNLELLENRHKEAGRVPRAFVVVARESRHVVGPEHSVEADLPVCAHAGEHVRLALFVERLHEPFRRALEHEPLRHRT